MTGKPSHTDTAGTDWTVEDLRELRGDGEPGTDLVPAAWTQSEWDRRQVRQLKNTEHVLSQLADSRGTPASVLVRESLLTLGYHRAAHEHMEATRREDERSVFAALCREWDAQVIDPTKVHTPGRRRKAPRGEGGRFIKGGAA